MALPRRCSKCRCYVADWLKSCPRCNTKAPPIIASKLPSEEREEAQAKADAKLPTIKQSAMLWAPSEFAVAAHRNLEREVLHKIKKADTPRMRNAFRSELRSIRAVLTKKVPRRKRWTYQVVYDSQGSVMVFTSPKKRKYVLAERWEPADLIVLNRARTGFPTTRLVRYETSNVFGRVKREEKVVKQLAEKAVAKERAKQAKERTLKKLKRK